jgi:nucleotide-binding universal stress UspA family protein
MKILVAIDGTAASQHAVKYAAQLIKALSSTANAITLISVHDDIGLRHAKTFVGKDTIADYLRELSEKDLKAAQKYLDKVGVKHDMEVRTGHVAQEIVQCAKKGKFDLIAMGAKGRGAMSDLLLGSVAQRVLAMAEIPVVLVK